MPESIDDIKAALDRAPILDAETIDGLRELSDDQSIALELIEIFVKTSPERLAAIAAGIDKGDAKAVREQAHCLKSASGTVGAARLSKVFALLEASAAAPQPETRAILGQATAGFQAACAALIKEFPQAARFTTA